MQVHYRVEIKDPKNHLVTVTISLPKQGDIMEVFLPSWSPGSYLMREYARHIRSFRAQQKNGEVLFSCQVDKATFAIDFTKSELNVPQNEFSIEYDIYCHELTVRTSHVDESHAFLHGPSYLMGIVGELVVNPSIEFRFPALWSKLATGLKDISSDRSVFLYQAADYDELIDTPVEIGCHESDGFIVGGRPHHLNFYGPQYPHEHNLKADIQKIVETISQTWQDIPYEQYVFITHMAPNLYGGLEHHNSTTLHFDGTLFHDRKKYLTWLELVSHEYFHTWNVKRIRPKELGPFDYRTENYTRMHWLTEGLTSFMDKLLVLRSGLMTLKEYLEKITKELNAYNKIPGRKFHSLEDSSFNTWIKLYRPDENSDNSSISYYLKGGLVFLALQCMLGKKHKDIVSLLHHLWKRYQQNPQKGLKDEEVYQMIENISDAKTREKFEVYITTTQEIDFESHLKDIGLKIEWEEQNQPYLGIKPRFWGDQVFVKTILLDGPAYQAGLNAGDEILFMNDVRFLKKQWEEFPKIAKVGTPYQLLLSRQGLLKEAHVICENAPRKIKNIWTFKESLTRRVLEAEQ